MTAVGGGHKGPVVTDVADVVAHARRGRLTSCRLLRLFGRATSVPCSMAPSPQRCGRANRSSTRVTLSSLGRDKSGLRLPDGNGATPRC